MTPFVIDSRSALALALAGVLSAQAPTQPPALALWKRGQFNWKLATQACPVRSSAYQLNV